MHSTREAERDNRYEHEKQHAKARLDESGDSSSRMPSLRRRNLRIVAHRGVPDVGHFMFAAVTVKSMRAEISLPTPTVPVR